MPESNFRGPVNSMGTLELNSATAAIEATDGPGIFYQGLVQPDIRSAPFAKDGFRSGQQPGFMTGSVVWGVDAIIQARTTTQLATTQTVTAAVAMSLATVAAAGVASVASIAVGVPIIPVGTSVVTYAIALDFGFTTGTTTAGSTTVVVVDNTLFRAGGWIVIGGAGNAAATRSHIAQVQSVATANLTGITISPAAVTGIASAPIGQGNLINSGYLPLGTQFGPATASASAHSYAGGFSGGLARTYNPREMSTRNIVVSSLTASSFSCVVAGWDLYGNAMTEVISMAAQTTVAGKRAFKYLGSVTSGTTSGVAISLGLGDTVGLPFRADEWDQVDVSWANSKMTNANGFTAAILGPTATSTSGDVRGTIQLSTAVLTGVIATAISAVSSNGTSRVTIKQSFGVHNQIFANPLAPKMLFGIAQGTGTT